MPHHSSRISRSTSRGRAGLWRSFATLACAVAGIAAGLLAFAARAADEDSPSSPERPAAAAAPVSTDDLTKLNLEDLMNVEVRSVSKQKQRASEAPSAVTVITSDDMQRSHLDSVPELLRLVPGMDVARLNANTWAISAHGFNDVYANKLLVLMDGRTVYSPLFSGVFWDMQETLVQDLDRIEVIRGPGAALWGSNAVNGVVNITSKSARDTQGLLFDGRYGTDEQRGSLRYGGKISDDTYYRVWGQYRNTENFPLSSGRADDGWDALSGGFRLDKYSGHDDTFTVIGNAGAFRESVDLLLPQITPPFQHVAVDDFNAHGANLLGRWSHVISDRSDFTLQVYYDHVDRHVGSVPYRLETADVDFQHRFPVGQRQEIIWGAGYRYWADDAEPVPGYAVFSPQRRDDYIANAFVQDDVTIVKDRLHFIVGTKMEENSISGFEVQPSARVLWTPSEKQTVWGAVSRAVRTPSRYEQDGRISANDEPLPPAGTPAVLTVVGNRAFDSEEMMAYELGYRLQATRTLSLDAATFYNRYDHVRSFEPGTPGFGLTPIPHVNLPLIVSNKIDVNTYGFELAANWKVTERWRLAGSYTLMQVDAKGVGSSQDTGSIGIIEGSHPRNQVQLHSYVDLTRNLQFDASAYYVENLTNQSAPVPSYLRVDLALTWAPKPNLEFTVGVQNLLDPRHPEFGSASSNIGASEVPRTVFAQLTCRF